MSSYNPITSPGTGQTIQYPKGSQYMPPWRQPYIIGIAGCSGSGKTSVSSKIIKKINVPWTVLLSMDNFYAPLSEADRAKAFNSEYDFDRPEAFDWDHFVKCVKDLKEGSKRVEIPVYSFEKHDRTDKVLSIYGANVIILEGIYVLHDPRILELLDMKIFVDTDLDICLARRLNRDILHRGRDLTGAILQWNRYVKPNFDKYVRLTMSNADILIPRGLDNTVAIEMIIKHISRQLTLKSHQHIEHLIQLGHSPQELELSAQNLIYPISESSPQLLGIHTLLLDTQTCRGDFIFFFNRMATILITAALELISYAPKHVVTPQGTPFDGLQSLDEIYAISVIRAGECFENSLKKTIPTIRLGKLLIQSDSQTGEPKLHTLNLPPQLEAASEGKSGKWTILLVDAQMTSGAAAIMAISVLLDHGVKEEEIIFVTYLANYVAIKRFRSAFANVKLVVGKVEKQQGVRTPRFIDEKYYGT
ncbi:uridine kinase [Nadsonia fulvescens var. elongata DSM 6958]|uniref:Uridine kinase n=1 Tax=Nadsonia fulvescens var. elongata DSM 6958 TaxID=857566 RepID=A0A1E3PT93_9ASCO|nr:uridine kinase [Nadsonia fulvescens var. elongata DSM 6958]